MGDLGVILSDVCFLFIIINLSASPPSSFLQDDMVNFETVKVVFLENVTIICENSMIEQQLKQE